MKKILKKLIWTVVCIALAIGAVRFGPALLTRILGQGSTQWISERFTESLKEKNELVVYELELTGQETVSQQAWLIGTVQKVELPYTFQMSYTVDLSQAMVRVEGNTIEVRVPEPVPGYHKLIVDENNVKKSDWLYPLTSDRYAQIIKQVEDKLFGEYTANEEYLTNAWNVTVRNLETLFRSVTDSAVFTEPCTIRVVMTDASDASASYTVDALDAA